MANSDRSALPLNDQTPPNTYNTNDQNPLSIINNQPHQPPLVVSTIITIKLTCSNYPLWLAQISPILRSHDFFGYVDGTILCPPKFLPVTVRAAYARDTPITYEALEALLLDAERHQGEQAQPQVDPTIGVSAFAAARGRGGRRRSFGRGFTPNRNSSPNSGGRGQFRPNSNFQCDGTSGDAFSSTVSYSCCQICGNNRHQALDCFTHMNMAYEGRVHTRCLSAMASQSNTNPRPNANTWLIDTGVNSHITPDLSTLNNPQEYNGNNQVGGIGHFSEGDVKMGSIRYAPDHLHHFKIWRHPLALVFLLKLGTHAWGIL
ncbi:unnamed protein product [Prunus armeniaca]